MSRTTMADVVLDAAEFLGLDNDPIPDVLVVQRLLAKARRLEKRVGALQDKVYEHEREPGEAAKELVRVLHSEDEYGRCRACGR